MADTKAQLASGESQATSLFLQSALQRSSDVGLRGLAASVASTTRNKTQKKIVAHSIKRLRCCFFSLSLFSGLGEKRITFSSGLFCLIVLPFFMPVTVELFFGGLDVVSVTSLTSFFLGAFVKGFVWREWEVTLN